MAAWATGISLGPYVLLAPIGAGGMGEVWKARDTRLDRIVAVKRLKGQHSARFEQEARAIAALNHNNVCQIFDVGPDYLVLEYIDGTALHGPLPVDEAVRLAIQIASALEEAHGRGILHRDLKPANILVTAKGAAKVLDFGLAKLAIGSEADATQTIEGTVLGTAAYMSPEQAQGKPLDERSDIFSFGAVLYEVLSGRRAFGGDSILETLNAVVRSEPAPLDSLASTVVKRCLAKAPEDRFQTMAEMKAALEQCSAKPREQQPSIAVLPFTNMSADKEQEYFSDGLAEEILNLLAKTPGLKVTARTSSFAFRGKEQDITKIAETLRVRAILEGSVRRAGNRIRVTAQLINAADGYHLWSERYDREMTDVFAVQDEIAAAIAGALHVKLTVKEAQARSHEPNLGAWEAFLKGMHQFYKFSPDGFARAEGYFKEAIALDPQWASARSSLAWQYFNFGMHGFRPLSETIPLARAEAQKALELLSSDPMAHLVIGTIAALHDYDWKEAEEQFSLAKSPGSDPLGFHAMYAQFYLLPLGRFEESIEERSKAIAQDPLNVLLRTAQAITLLAAEKYEPAIAEARKALEIDDRFHMAHYVIARTRFSQGSSTEAREAAEEAVRIAPWNAGATGLLAGLLAIAGEKDRAQKLLAALHGMDPGGMVMYHLTCSEIDAAIDWYQRLVEVRQPQAALMASAGFLKPLRASPRWPKLAKMMNLQEKA